MAVPNLWRTKKQRYSLQAQVCPHCVTTVFPQREICPHCHQPMSQTTKSAALVSFPLVMDLPQQAAVSPAGDD